MKAPSALEFRLLGPLEAWREGERVDLGAPKQRAVLALLLLHRGEAVSTERIVDELWGEQPPRAATKSVQVYVSGLRKALGDDSLETRGHGYALNAEPASVDAERFETLLADGRELLASDDAGKAAAKLREALGLWRGPALADFTYDEFAQEPIARSEEVRLAALEARIDADLARGRHADLVPELNQLVSEHPLREGFRGQLMLALYRSGRQSEALEAYQAGRRELLERGLEPGPSLRELEAAILRQDPELGAAARSPRPVTRRRAGVLIAAGGAILLAAAVAAAVAVLTSDETSASAPLAHGVAAISAPGRDVDSFTHTRTLPGNVAVGDGAVWVLDTGGPGTVSRIAPDTGEIEARFDVGRPAVEVAAGGGAVWVGTVGGEGGTNTFVSVSRLDGRTGKVTRVTELPGGGEVFPTAGLPRLAVGAGAVWAVNPDGSISRIDLETGELVARIDTEAPAWTIAAGDEGVWYLSVDAGSSVMSIDPRTNRTAQRIDLSSELLWGVATGAGSVWATTREQGLLWRIEPGRNPVNRSIDVGAGVTSVAFGAGAVWTGNYIDGTVARVDPEDNAVTGKTPVDAPQALAAGEGGAWVSVAGRSTGGPLAAPACGPVEPGGADPDVLIASDLPLQGPGSGDPRAMASAIRFVLERHGYRAGRHTVGYQSCDVSTAETGGFEFRKCAANANSYAHARRLVAVIGTYSSFCAEVQIPILNRAPGGSIAMISPSNTGPQLTRGGPLASVRGEPGIYYPTGVRNFMRVAPREDLQGAAQAVLADQLGLDRVAVVVERDPDWRQTWADPFRRAARERGLQTELFAYDAEAASFGPLAERVANAGPDGVFVLGSIDEGGDKLVRALRSKAGDDVTIHVLDLFGPVPYVLEKLGPAAHGIYMSFTDTPPHALDLSPAGERFVRDFGYLDNPTPYVLPAAQAAESVLEAIARSDGTRRSVLARLRTTKVEDGILGSFRLDPFGDIDPGRIPIFRITGRTTPGEPVYEIFEGAVVDRVIMVPSS